MSKSVSLCMETGSVVPCLRIFGLFLRQRQPENGTGGFQAAFRAGRLAGRNLAVVSGSPFCRFPASAGRTGKGKTRQPENPAAGFSGCLARRVPRDCWQLVCEADFLSESGRCRFIVSPNKKYTALARLAVLLVLSAARCLVSFLF